MPRKRDRVRSSPRIEALEGRTLLSADVIASPVLDSRGVAVDAGSYDPSRIIVRYKTDAVGPVALTGAAALVPGLKVIAVPAGSDVASTLATYRADPTVAYAEPNFRVSVGAVPNDSLFGSEWGLNNTGQGGGVADADIDAPEAWDRTTGSGTIVAIIDTGVLVTHPDLAANIWVNAGEVAGNGIDDDGNGFVDDINGYDFANNDGNPDDDHGHGTHTAGTVGAVGNNGIGVAGVAWNVKLMALKFIDASGEGFTSDAVASIQYAVANGASVSNNSWAGDEFSQGLYDAIKFAGDRNHIFVAAAGNNGRNTDTSPIYPASHDLANIVSVAATNNADALASFSNYGITTVDIAAPGVSILSTTRNGGYGNMSGTSMAAPHVAGVVALVRGQHPDWTNAQVIGQVLSTADPIASVAGKVATGGRLNAARAVQASGAQAITTAAFDSTDTTTRGTWKGTYGLDGYNIAGSGVSNPSYATVALSGQSTWVWAGSTNDARALQKPAANATDRISSTWYNATALTIDLNLTDGNKHKVSLYSLDWDRKGRAQRVDVIDASSGALLDSRTISAFGDGVYTTWTLQGNIRLQITRTGGNNAAVAGIFFGSRPLAGTASYVATDAATSGTWKGIYGSEGYNVVGDASSYPSYASVTTSGQSNWTWLGSTADTRALQKPAAGSTDRVAATWYNATSFNIDISFNDGKSHMVSLYALDWDRQNRGQRVDVIDASTGALLDSRTITAFTGGVYTTWNLSGNVRLQISRTSGNNAAVAGLFFGTPATPSSATFLATDTATRGNWKGVYGAEGYSIVGDATSTPGYVTVTPAGQSTWAWTGSTTDPRALQKSAAGSTGRLAATWYNATSFTVDLNFNDGKAHKVSLYALDWDRKARGQRVDVIDSATGAVLDSRTLASFTEGTYLSWNLSGKVQLKFTRLTGNNAALAALFFDAAV